MNKCITHHMYLIGLLYMNVSLNVKAGEFSGKLSIMMALFLLETSAQHCSAEKNELAKA